MANSYERNRRFIYKGCIVILLAITACSTPKNIAYMQDADKFNKQKIKEQYKITVQNDDLLSIVIASRDTALAAPFNIGASTTGSSGYLVDTSGRIILPQLGTLKVAGLSTLQIADTIKNILINNGYIKDPTVIVRLQNFKVAVMGEVTTPGVFPVATERITILEALSKAGDLSVYGQRGKVLVIREKDGERSMNYINLESVSLVESPYYFLQQNDVVYVEPNKVKTGQGNYNPRNLPIALASVSILTSIVSLILLIAR